MYLRELESLKKFINTTAEKEMVGRQKLEEFISELIDRADQAERELDLMRRKSNVNSEHISRLLYMMALSLLSNIITK